MKIRIKQFTIILAAAVSALITACEKNDKDADFGLERVYMPQAVLANLNYNVPMGNDVSNYNFTVDDSKVNIRLGVLRSGKTTLNGYTATLAANRDTITTLISNNTLTNTVLMPANMYTLPQTVAVADGQAGAPFMLSLDKAMVKTYAGKKLALGVAITSTSAYTINQAINKVVVIVNVDALKL